MKSFNFEGNVDLEKLEKTFINHFLLNFMNDRLNASPNLSKTAIFEYNFL